MKALNVKVGDEVTVLQRSRVEGIFKVDKITPAGFIKVGDTLYKPDGSRRGDTVWDDNSIVPTTQEHRDALVKRNLLAKIDKVNMAKLSLDQLKDIIAIIKGES